MDLSHLTQLPPAFMNETQKTVGLKAWMTCLSVEQLGLTESLKTDIPQKCIINPSKSSLILIFQSTRLVRINFRHCQK